MVDVIVVLALINMAVRAVLDAFGVGGLICLLVTDAKMRLMRWNNWVGTSHLL